MKALVAVLGGDGIGPDVVAQAVQVLEATAQLGGHHFELAPALFGGAAIDVHGDGLPPATLDLCRRASSRRPPGKGSARISSPIGATTPQARRILISC